jgi:hypothetical protein
MTKDEALKMAIDWIEKQLKSKYSHTDILNACKKALEQPSQEPVYFVKHPNGYGWIDVDKNEYNQEKYNEDKWKLYTHPHQWQGLTDDEIKQCGKGL